MQHRSEAYQAVISLTRVYGTHGFDYSTLVEAVATYVNPDRALEYRLGKLKRMPNETDAETTSKGQKDIARRYIDAAHRQGLIIYGEPTNEALADQPNIDYGRQVFWRRFARNGGRYSTPEAGEELRRHRDFMSRHVNDLPDE